jgi:hypothetical protein
VALSATYSSRDEAFKGMDAVAEAYKGTDYYTGHEAEIQAAIDEMKAIYDRTVFPEQKVDWTTYPTNLGHINAPGCFRCHDGKHLNDQNQAVRLECNLCHSIPVVADSQDFIANIEINRSPEPESHLNANWINLHNKSYDATCANCHTVKDAGGTSNTSFCSNSACHGSVFTYAGFDAPKLREILQSQIPTPAPTTSTATANPTFDNYIGALFAARCTAPRTNPHGGTQFPYIYQHNERRQGWSGHLTEKQRQQYPGQDSKRKTFCQFHTRGTGNYHPGDRRGRTGKIADPVNKQTAD